MSLFLENFVRRLKILLYTIYLRYFSSDFVNFRHIQGFSRDQIMAINK